MRRRFVLILIALPVLAALAACFLAPAALAQAPGPYEVYLPLLLRPAVPVNTPTPSPTSSPTDTPTVTPTATPGSTPIQRYVSARDAYIFEAGPDVNRGSDTFLMAGYDEDAESMERKLRSLIWFDVPTANNWQVAKATLRVYHAGFSDIEDEPRLTTAHSADGAWTESTVTWANQPTLGEAYGSVSIMANKDWGYREIDVTTLVQQWFDGTLANNGIYLIGPEVSGSDYSYRMFFSREVIGTDKPYPPELVITLQ